jgi:hypothetical protein
VGWTAASTDTRAGSSERAGSDADTGVVSGREGKGVEDGGGDDGGEEGGGRGDVGAVVWTAAGTGASAGSSERAGLDADTGVISGREGEA